VVIDVLVGGRLGVFVEVPTGVVLVLVLVFLGLDLLLFELGQLDWFVGKLD
jgi:hypothetical protein